MTLRTLPESAPRIDGEALATAWLAAGAAGSRAKGDRRLDRALTIETYRKGQALAGYAFIGTSADVAVVACVPVYQGPVGPTGLRTLVHRQKPVDRWPIDDQRRGAVMLRQTLTDTHAIGKKGGKVWATLVEEMHVPEGTLGDTGARAYVSIAIDGSTEGLLVERATFTPIDWRDILPGKTDNDDDLPAADTESATLYGRLSRILSLLPVTEVEWTVRRASNGATVRAWTFSSDLLTVDVVHGQPSIWKVADTDPLTAYEQGALDDEDDAVARRLVESAFDGNTDN